MDGIPFEELIFNTRDPKGVPKIIPPGVLEELYEEAVFDKVAEIDRELNKHYFSGVTKESAEELVRGAAGSANDLLLSKPHFRNRLGLED